MFEDGRLLDVITYNGFIKTLYWDMLTDDFVVVVTHGNVFVSAGGVTHGKLKGVEVNG